MSVPRTAKSYKQLQSKLKRKSMRRRIIRASLLTINLVILAAVLGFTLTNTHGSNSPMTTKSAVASADSNAPAANPLDQLSSADIALTIARMNALPESTAINSQAISQSVELTQAPATDNVVTKPEVVATALKTRADIQSYTSQAGDTLSALATKFGVTSDSIRWSNSLGSADAVPAGKQLVIPPVTGIVYTVQAGDTVASLADKYKASPDKLSAFNDAEIAGLTTGEQIVIPDGTEAAAAVITAAKITAVSSGAATSFPWGGSAQYGGNGYAYGYCTWYVASRIQVPNNWGNANTWDNLAPLSGWTVSATPQVGAIAQTDSGYDGHVAYVEAVSPDGSQIQYSDMNGLSGWGRVGFSGWVPASHFEHYIYR